jgi:cytoskeletal protein CcmA (bactofilin family)
MSMWNKRKDDEPSRPVPPTITPKPAPPEPIPVPVKKEAIPSTMSSTPFRSPEMDNARGAATIGKAVKVNGQIVSQEDLYVDGDVEGTVELVQHKLTIGPNGKVHAAIKSREVVVLGSIQGNVEASDKIEIRKDARLVGDIKTARIIIEDGAYFKGSIDIVKPEPKAAPAPAPAARPAQASASATPAPQTAPAAAAEMKR